MVTDEAGAGHLADAGSERDLVVAVLDSLVAFAGLLRPDGVVVESNSAALETAGLRPDDVIGLPLWETPWWSWSGPEQERLRAAVARAAAGDGVRYDAEVRVSDDRRMVVDFRIEPLRDADGRVTRLLPSGVDVTERRDVEHLLEGIITHAPVGFAQFDREMRFVRVNRELAAMNGFTVEEHIGRTPMELLPQLPPQAYLPYFRDALRGRTTEFHVHGITGTGEPGVWLERVYPLRDRSGRVAGLGVFVVDITARTAAEGERERLVMALQQSLLPRGIPPVEGLDIATRYATASGALDVGGDFYEVLWGPAFGVAAFVGDVCGRGVEAAAVTALARYTLVPLIERHPGEPATAVTELDRIIREHHPETDRFLTLALVVMRPGPAGADARVALGGHPQPVLVRRRGGAQPVGRIGTLLAAGTPMRVHDAHVTLAPGDALVLYTDGYTEARGDDGELFGDERLLGALAGAAGGSAEELADALERAVADFTHRRGERDDRALLVLRATGAGAEPAAGGEAG
ncbi:PAS domain-containing protein [Miltoncostaea marina]|uniref:PAS domain-containing protein n=1 Tax=Miltoncostaea marina TaxID=2843215 RepID=UPI001C3E4272|nr:PAS domain-containing protein [Miltoncostaea marina]